jgi:ubiquitin-like 1-activating enzyme E1 B
VLRAIEASLGKDLLHHIRTTAKVLVVGAGGIGCELLKNLALCGFASVSVIDLDTIDVSNLNRQLLFRSQHVGMPKAAVACEVAGSHLSVGISKERNGSGNDNSSTDNESTPTAAAAAPAPVAYKAMHGNVCDNDVFNVPFVSQFDVVLNALDNVTARRRVNRLCLAANDGAGVPMVEAGTTGYLGQVTVITRAVQCYECRPQEPPKVYPICTIRSTPSAPVHTIVWAKECYKLLFCPKVEESMLYEAMDEEEHNDNGSGSGSGGTAMAKADPNDEEKGGYEPSVYMRHVLEYRAALLSSSSSSSGVDGTDADHGANGNGSGTVEAAPPNNRVHMLARNLLKALYCDEINKQLDMGRYKTAKKTPVAMAADLLVDDIPAPTSHPAWSATHVWTQQECASEFVKCLVDAFERKDNAVLPEFDKDDELAMRFVTAASNLRNHVFGIEPLQSYYSAKVRGTRGVCVTLRHKKATSFVPRSSQHVRSFSLSLTPLFQKGIAGNIIPAVRERVPLVDC